MVGLLFGGCGFKNVSYFVDLADSTSYDCLKWSWPFLWSSGTFQFFLTYFLHANDLVADIKEISGAKSVRLFGSDVAY